MNNRIKDLQEQIKQLEQAREYGENQITFDIAISRKYAEIEKIRKELKNE